MYKELLLLISCNLISTTVLAEQRIGGYDYENNKTYFETSDVISFGNVVIGKLNTSKPGSRDIHYGEYIYFCGFKELISYSSTSIYYKNNGEYDKTRKTNLSESTSVIGLEKNSDMLIKVMGVQVFVGYLEKKCSNLTKKFPKIEIPFTRSQSTVDHVMLDTFVINKNLRSAWIKRSNTNSEKVLDSNNKPIQIDGTDYIQYTIDKNKGYSLLHTVVDCQKNMIGHRNYIEYSEKGNIVSSEKETSEPSMRTIVPNSLGEQTRDFLCKI